MVRSVQDFIWEGVEVGQLCESYAISGKWRKAKTRKLAHSKKLRVKKFPLDFAVNSKMETLINAGDFEGDCNN
jgi:hypothetical protein